MKKLLLLSLLFITQTSFAEMMCDTGISKYRAIYEPNSYTCSSGQYLPANSLGCESCPDDYTCTGGTYTFNENEYQGAVKSSTYITHNMTNMCATNAPNRFDAVFTPNTHNCNPGYYLPANVDVCTICPKDNYCGGGTYTFNETTTQGITACSGTTPYAPAGSPVCYPRMMHLSDERPEDVIYLKTTETTAPAFHVNINGTVYHANMTTTPTYMTSASTHYLKIMVDNVEYYVCDDTTYSE